MSHRAQMQAAREAIDIWEKGQLDALYGVWVHSHAVFVLWGVLGLLLTCILPQSRTWRAETS